MTKHTPVSESNVIGKSHVRLIVSCCLLLILICLPAEPVQAQVLYGSLTGNVTDSSGAAIPDAKVEALNLGTGVSRTVTADSSGIYRMDALPAGVYKVTISAPKFGTSVTEDVSIVVNNIRRVDGQLKVASTAQDVTVTTEAPVLQTDKADVHTDLSAQQITNLPITSSVGGRNFQSLLRVVPGFGLLTESNSAGANPGRAMATNVNGQSLNGINTRIDGAQDAYPWLPANIAYVPPADAIETVNVVTNSFDPEQGMAGGAAVNVQVKSGTNQYHGSAHEFHTDQSLRTRNYFKTDLTRFPTKARENKNQFGGTFGGPIKKDKLFFFADFERTTQRQLAQATLTLPTAAMRTGDFSAIATPIYDPLTADASGVKQQFSCNGVANVICPNRIDSAAAAIMAGLPAVTSTALTNNYVTKGTGQLNRNNVDAKVNWVPTKDSTVFGRYSIQQSTIFDPPSLGILGGDATAGGQLGNSTGRVQSIGLGGTYIFSPNIVGDWNAGFTRQRLGATNIDIDQAYGSDTLKIPGANGVGVTGDPALYNGYPAIQTTGASNIGNVNTGNPFLFRDNQYVWGANLSWTKGKHALRFGYEYNHSQVNHFQPQGADGNFTTARGSFGFDGRVTSQFNVAASNPVNSVAQLLLGLPNRVGKASYLWNPNALRWPIYSWYVRDQWQITPKFTATLGVRWEFYPFGYSDNGRGLAVFNPLDGNVYVGGYGDVPRNSFVDTHSGQFLPRIGLAYRLTGKTVIRAGYGMSADPNNYRFLRNAFPATITTDINNQNGTSLQKETPVAALTATNPNITGPYGTAGATVTLPAGLTQQITAQSINLSTGKILLPNGAATRTYPRDFRRGYINSFNFTVQQEFAGFVAEAAYVGARGIRPLTGYDLNSGPIGSGNGGRLINQQLGYCTIAIPTCLGGISVNAPFGNNYYDSLQTKVTRRFAHGNQISLVYTFSKTEDLADNDDLSGLFRGYPDYWPQNKARAGYDRPHNLQIYGIYALPFGRGQRFASGGGFKDYFIGGWQASTVISRLSGTPFSVQAAGNVGSGNTQTADLVGKYAVLDSKPWSGVGQCKVADLSCHYFDPGAFAQPAGGRFGNTSRNQFRGPGIFNADLSLFKNFKITEKVNFQFRTDFFSLTNTPRFSNPNGTTGNACSPTAPSLNCGTAANGNLLGAITTTLGTSGSNASTDGTRTIWFSGKITF